MLWIGLVLTACNRTASAESTFATPLANQVAVHQADHQEQADHRHTKPAQTTVAMQVVLVASELVVGPNRFAVGLLHADGQMITAANVHFRYFDLSNPQAPQVEAEADASQLQTPDGLTAIFAHERSFLRAGDWGVEVAAALPDGAVAVKRIGFTVLATSPTVNIGEAAPVVDTPTVAAVNNDFGQLTTAPTPNPAFYQLSLADALTNGKPTVLLFATPAFCQTRFCGPAYAITDALQKRYGERANFVHVEVYTGLPNPAVTNWQITPAMQAFGLSTEPWLYLIDPQGVVVYRVEGLFTVAEVEGQLAKVLR
ncbi:MAG: hypothetical protein DYG89_40130 [Caldilinea sp. CFX5]|nr:hypothetical protein [Caldilinea sp. CFX5]